MTSFCDSPCRRDGYARLEETPSGYPTLFSGIRVHYTRSCGVTLHDPPPSLSGYDDEGVATIHD